MERMKAVRRLMEEILQELLVTCAIPMKGEMDGS